MGTTQNDLEGSQEQSSSASPEVAPQQEVIANHNQSVVKRSERQKLLDWDRRQQINGERSGKHRNPRSSELRQNRSPGRMSPRTSSRRFETAQPAHETAQPAHETAQPAHGTAASGRKRQKQSVRILERARSRSRSPMTPEERAHRSRRSGSLNRTSRRFHKATNGSPEATEGSHDGRRRF